jgi:methoxymalonate biosynthesis acyl carrier protein
MDIREQIRSFIENNLVTFETASFADDDNIFELGLVNSLFAMSMLTYIEQAFFIHVEMEDMEIENFSTVNRIASLIEKKQQEISTK